MVGSLEACHAPSLEYRSMPSAPRETNTQEAPRSRSMRAPSSRREHPVAARSSCSLGLRTSAYEAASTRAVPEVSRMMRAPEAFAASKMGAISPARASPGSDPQIAQTSPGVSTEARNSALWDQTSRGGACPASLKIDTSRSRRATDLRVGAGESIQRVCTRGARLAKRSRTRSPVAPPRGPVAHAEAPNWSATRATLRPFPPGLSSMSVTRVVDPRSHPGTPQVMSSAGLGVTV